MIIVNYKNYVRGKETLKLSKSIEKNCPGAIVCAPAFDLSNVKNNTSLKIFAQHIDFFEGERETGYLLASAAKEAGAIGTILNHSEHPIFSTQIERTIRSCKKEGLLTLICIKRLEQAHEIIHLEPWGVAYEDPELIASGKSVTEFNTINVKKFVAMMRQSKSLAICGAGISSAKDVKEALEIGCDGVLIASAIAANKKPEKLLKELAEFA